MPENRKPCSSLLLGITMTACVVQAQSIQPRWLDTWDKCVAAAKVEAKPIFLLVTAPQWDPGSRAFETKVLSHYEVLKHVELHYLPYRIEITLRDDRKLPTNVAEQNRRVLQHLHLYGHQGLPRVILLQSDERIYGRTGPVGTPKDFLASLAEWEAARALTIQDVRSEEEATRYINDATAARNLKNPVRALEAARLAVAANPRSPLAHFMCGLALLDLGQHAEARKFYFAALSLDSTGNPANGAGTIWAAGSWYNLAVAALNEKKEAEALFFLRENQRTDRRTDAPLLRCAELHIAASRPDLAFGEYGELLSRDGFSAAWLRTYLELQPTVWKEK